MNPETSDNIRVTLISIKIQDKMKAVTIPLRSNAADLQESYKAEDILKMCHMCKKPRYSAEKLTLPICSFEMLCKVDFQEARR